MAVMTFSYALGNPHQMTYLERLALRQGLHSLSDALRLSGTNKLHVSQDRFELPPLFLTPSSLPICTIA